MNYIKDVNDGIKRIVNNNNVNNTIKYSLSEFSVSAGKKIRSKLILTYGNYCNVPYELLVDLGVIVELLHSSTLMLDDLPCMDNHLKRRNNDSVHIKYNESTAILSSFAGLLLSIEDIIKTPHFTDNNKNMLIKTICNVFGPSGMISGQVLDLENKGKNLDLKEIYDIFKLKTGLFFGLIIDFVDIVQNKTKSENNLVKELFVECGCLYQVKDDIVDFKNKNFNDVLIADLAQGIELKEQTKLKIEKLLLKIDFELSEILIKFINEVILNENLFY